jgi:hypothetical protein
MLARSRLNRAIIEEEFRKRRDLALLIQGWKFLHINTTFRSFLRPCPYYVKVVLYLVGKP